MSTALLERDPAPSAPDIEPPASRTSTPVIIAFGLVYVVWGSTYLAIRVGIESFPPLLLAGSRHLLTGLILYPILRWKTGARPTAAHWGMSFITGFLLLCVGNGGVCLAERTGPSGVAALLVATVSLWMVLLDWLRPGGTRPGARVVAGLLLGFSGLALLVGPKNLGGSSRVDPIGGWAFGGCLTGVGCGIRLLQACRGPLRFTLNGSGDAVPCGWSFVVDCGDRAGRGWRAPS